MNNQIKATIIDGLCEQNIPQDIVMDLYIKWMNGKKVKEITELGLTVSFDMAW